MTIAAIPTVYNGIQFRSRLEARWAAFFANLEIHAEYEPIDLAGYIPDFIIGQEKLVLFEVKPLTVFDMKEARRINDASMLMNGYHEIFISHTAPMPVPDLPCVKSIGWNASSPEHVAVVVPVMHDTRCFAIGMYTAAHGVLGLFRDIKSDIWNLPIRFNDGKAIDDAWHAACNSTQWRGVQNDG